MLRNNENESSRTPHFPYFTRFRTESDRFSDSFRTRSPRRSGWPTRMVEAGKPDLAFPTPLAMYGVRQFRAGRRVGTKSNVNDISSPYAQAGKDIRPGRLDHFDHEDDSWKEISLEGRHAGPAETAAVRIDFSEWLRRLPPRQSWIAEVLATGESTAVAARQFRISPGRISQIRRELKECWDEFQGEARGTATVARTRRLAGPSGRAF